MKQIVGGADLRRMIISAAAAIENNKQGLNELNVFPVPDGDTGTNMSMTINAAASDLRKAEDPDLGNAAKIAASAMLRGARGNSGVILSLLFRGISRKLKGLEYCDGVLWAAALQEGVDAAYKAVMKPAEGTILTVARLAAATAQDAAQANNFIEFVQAAAIEEGWRRGRRRQGLGHRAGSHAVFHAGRGRGSGERRRRHRREGSGGFLRL